MARYHVNPETMRPNICSASSPEKCKFSSNEGVAPHFATKDEASTHMNETLTKTYGTFTPLKKEPKVKQQAPAVNHADKRLLQEILISGKGRHTKQQNHYSANAGKLNPTSFEGTASDYMAEGENSFVVLADDDGKGVRVISSSGEFYSDPESKLGAPAVQYKQSGDRDTKKYLNVVGYIGIDGDRFGYIPDSQVSAFVYK